MRGARGVSIDDHAAVRLLLDRVHGAAEQGERSRVVDLRRIAHALAVQQRGVGTSVVGQQQGVPAVGVAIVLEQQGELVGLAFWENGVGT